MRLARTFKIAQVFFRYRLDTLLPAESIPWLVRIVLSVLTLGAKPQMSRGQRLRKALEELGPIFVKFGQLLSTRRDMLPVDVADELSALQDRVPAEAPGVAERIIKQELGKTPVELFDDFEPLPVASASIAQVHFAVLKDPKNKGRAVAIKVLRPGMHAAIKKDLALLKLIANWIERFSSDGRRLKPNEVVAEFDRILHDELDLLREASNCALLRRNFPPGSARGNLLHVPEVFWDYCRESVFVMERMKGIPISDVARLAEHNIDLKKLSRDGVEIFFTQVVEGLGGWRLLRVVDQGGVSGPEAPRHVGQFVGDALVALDAVHVLRRRIFHRQRSRRGLLGVIHVFVAVAGLAGLGVLAAHPRPHLLGQMQAPVLELLPGVDAVAYVLLIEVVGRLHLAGHLADEILRLVTVGADRLYPGGILEVDGLLVLRIDGVFHGVAGDTEFEAAGFLKAVVQADGAH